MDRPPGLTERNRPLWGKGIALIAPIPGLRMESVPSRAAGLESHKRHGGSYHVETPFYQEETCPTRQRISAIRGPDRAPAAMRYHAG
jgi:hypothetical protein